MSNRPKYVNFGSMNHGSAARNPVHDEFVWQIKMKFIRLLWTFLKFCVRKWYWVIPISCLYNLMFAPDHVGVWVAFVLATVLCMTYRFKIYKPKVPPVLTEDEQEIARYSGMWRDVARNAGLAQKAPSQGVGLYKAYGNLSSETSAGRSLREAAYGAEDDSIVPQLVSVEPAPLGYTHTVRLLPGQTVASYSRVVDILAVLWTVAEVRVSPGVPGVVLLTPIVRDPMGAVDPITQENYRGCGANVHQVEIGILEDGTPWKFPLGVHSIVAGNSGGGKSVAYRALLSQMATIPELQVVGIDLKRGIELNSWRPRLSVTAKDMDGALDALNAVWAIAEQRLDFLEERGLTDMKDYGFSTEMPRLVVLIDEVSELFAVGEPDRELAKQGKEAVALVSKMLRLVRAAGITIIMATQRPSTEVIPSGIRELTQNRVAFRMMNSSGAVMALGELPDNSISPVDIPESKKGRAVVTDDQGHYSFGQCRFIDPGTAKSIAQETALLTIPLSALRLTSEAAGEADTIYEGEII